MKKLQFLRLLFAALLMVTMVSCDNEDDDNATPNNQSLLTAGVWNGDKIYYQGIDVTEDFAAIIDVKDTSIKFTKDGTYTITSDGSEEKGTWEFANNETQILMDKGTDDEMLVDVNKLTATELWVEGDFGNLGDEIEIRFVR